MLITTMVVRAVIRFKDAECPACGNEEGWSDANWYCTECGFTSSAELTTLVEAKEEPTADDLAVFVEALANEAVAYEVMAPLRQAMAAEQAVKKQVKS